MIKRWPRRREFLAYYLLLRIFGQREFNLAEAVDLLAPLLGSRKVADRLVKRLVKQRFLTRTRPMVYRARGLEELLGEALLVYFASRLRRIGYEAHVDYERGVVVVSNCDERLAGHPLVVCRESTPPRRSLSQL